MTEKEFMAMRLQTVLITSRANLDAAAMYASDDLIDKQKFADVLNSLDSMIKNLRKICFTEDSEWNQ